MIGVVAALAPVFALIVLGWVLKAGRLVGNAFWQPAERLTFYLLFPALLVASIGGAREIGPGLLPMAAALVAAALTAAALVTALRPPLARAGLGGPAFVAVFQGAIRPNTYVGIAAAYALFGDRGLTLVAAAVVAVIPLVNLLSIVAHLRWAGPARGAGPEAAPRGGWGEAVVPAFRNPIIVACVIGAALNVTGVGLPPVLGPMLEVLGRGALPLGLMAVGAGLDFGAVRRSGPAVALATAFKLVAAPAITYGFCAAFGVGGAPAQVAVMFMALPVSAASYVMARQMGGDGPLMAGIVAATTVGAAAAVPAAVALAG